MGQIFRKDLQKRRFADSEDLQIAKICRYQRFTNIKPRRLEDYRAEADFELDPECSARSRCPTTKV
jgi:hypothetical protein